MKNKKDKKEEENKKDPYDEFVDELIRYEEGTPSKNPKYEYGEMDE